MQQDLKSKYIQLSQEITNITTKEFQKVKNQLIRSKNDFKRKIKDLKLKQKNFQEFQKIRDSIEKYVPFYVKYEKTNIFQKYNPDALKSDKDKWKIYYNSVKCNVQSENSLSEDSKQIDLIDGQISNVQSEMMKLTFDSSNVLKQNEYKKYCSDIKDFDYKSLSSNSDYNIVLNEKLFSDIEKIKSITLFLERLQDNRKNLQETIDECSNGFSINRNCNECMQNPFNQKRLKFEKKAVHTRSRYSYKRQETETIFEKDAITLFENTTVIIKSLKDIEKIVDNIKEKQNILNEIKIKKEKIKEYENHIQYKVLHNSVIKLKEKRLRFVNHQKKLGFYLENMELINFMNSIWSFNKIDMVMSFLKSFNTVDKDYQLVKENISIYEKDLLDIFLQEKEIVKKWEKDLELKTEIESIEDSLTFYSKSNSWLTEMKKQRNYLQNQKYQDEIKILNNSKEILVFEKKYHILISFYNKCYKFLIIVIPR